MNDLEWLKKKGVVLNSHDLFCFCKLVHANLCGCIEQPPHEVEIECARNEAFNEVFYRPIFWNQGIKNDNQ